MSEQLQQTPLHAWHVQHGARIVDFAGWAMPVQYTSIVDEHQATRTRVGLFDISHMGRLRFDGSDAAQVLDRLLTRRVLALQPGQVRYSLVTNDEGGILDDVLVYALQQRRDGRPYWLLVVNASNRPKIVGWIEQRWPGGEARFEDLTARTAMIAVQGPRALELTGQLLDLDPGSLRYYEAREARINGQEGIVSRTGYTGEDGCELIVAAEQAAALWQQLIALGQPLGAVPAGLGARDTLRLEAGMPLYGHELSEHINPFEAGLGFAVQLKDHTFPGCERLAQLKQQTLPRVRVGLELADRRVPREHYPIRHEGQSVGEVTSGTFSPSLQRPIAMGYVAPELAAVGTELEVDIRGRGAAARVVELPFYKRS